MRIAALVEYDGHQFHGWQRQRQEPTVQATLEQAVSSVADEKLVVHVAGRTDTGVHARGQVVHFDTDKIRPMRSWLLGCNSRLPDSIAMLWLGNVDKNFHARHSALSRSYRYTVLNRWTRAAIDRQYVTWYRYPLDEKKMHQAAQALLGEHDFQSYRAQSCQARHGVRLMHEISVSRDGDLIHIDLEANGFLHHMVRNIVGTLFLVGRGEKGVEWPGEVLAARNRELAGATAKPNGLTLTAVRYPKQCNIPNPPLRGFPELPQ